MDKPMIKDSSDNNNHYPFVSNSAQLKLSPNQYTNGNQRSSDQNIVTPSTSADMMGLFQANFAEQNNPPNTNTLGSSTEDFYPYAPNEKEDLFTNGANNSKRDIRTRTTNIDKPPNSKKPTGGYINIIAKIILQSPLKKLKLRDIYCELQKNYEFFKESKGKWQNSVRHCLSSNDCFVNEKVSCHSEGKGGYWSVDIKNLKDLNLDCENNHDSRRRRRIRQRSSELFYTVPREHILKNLNELTEATLLVYFPDTHSIDFFPTHLRDIFMYIQKKYNIPRIPYSSEFLRKFFREYFNILLSNGSEGFEQAVMLCNQFIDRNDGSNSTELHNQMLYHHIDIEPQMNTQQPPLFTRAPPIMNMYDYSVGDPNKPQATFLSPFPQKSFENNNYYPQQLSNVVNNNNNNNNYDKSMYSYANKNMAESSNHYNNNNNNNIYKPMNMHPTQQFDSVGYNENYMNIYNSSNREPSSSNRDNQLPLYPPSNNPDTHNSYGNTDFNNHGSSIIPHNVMVEASPQCNDIAVNSKIYSPFEKEHFHSVKENISNNIQNPLIVHPNETVFIFPQPISHVTNSMPIQPCFPNKNGNINKNGP